MAYQGFFKRCELKYLLSREQQQIVLQAMEPHMALDKYGRTTIRNLYFDTDDYRLIRQSIEKPVYKEKLRLRSYERAGPDSTVFVELKKKYRHVVYKRRISMQEPQALAWICDGRACPVSCQIADEVDYFMDFYRSLHPTVFLSYDREAYYCKDGSDFRVTFDDTILCRQEELSLQSDVYGTPILSKEKVLMEIKCTGGIPLWMTQVLTQQHIYKTSFSKYGTAYQTIIFPELTEVSNYA